MSVDASSSDVSLHKSGPSDTTGVTPNNRRWWILAILGIAQLMVVLDATIVSIALPHAQASLHFSDADRQWIPTAYALAFGSLLLIGGRIADIIGNRRTLLIGAAGFAIASAVGGAAQNFGMLAAARAVQGGFGALLAPAILSILTTTFIDAKERAKAFGIFGAIAGAGASLGLLLGGVLTEYLDWRWTLYVNLIFAAITIVGGTTLLSRTRPAARPRIDVPGAIFITVGLFALVYGFSHAAPPTPLDSARWGDAQTIVSLIVAAVFLVGFVLTERRVRGPLLPLSIVADRNRGGALLAMFIASVGMFGAFLFLPYYFEQVQGYSAVKAGLAFLPMTGMIIVVASVGSTILVPRVSARILIPLGMAIAAVGIGLLTNIEVGSGYASVVLAPTMIMGVGMGFIFAPAFSLGTLGVDPEHSGVASAAVNAMQQVGGAIGTALLNTIAVTAAASYGKSHHISPLDPHASVHSYVLVFWIAAAVFVGGAIASLITLRSGVPKMDPNAEPAMAL